MATTNMISNFYLNAANDASQGKKEDNTKLINKLPQPFVKQNNQGPNTIMEESKTNTIESAENIHRKLLISAKKGDRDNFLECLET